jgi:hypothetical protein
MTDDVSLADRHTVPGMCWTCRDVTRRAATRRENGPRTRLPLPLELGGSRSTRETRSRYTGPSVASHPARVRAVLRGLPGGLERCPALRVRAPCVRSVLQQSRDHLRCVRVVALPRFVTPGIPAGRVSTRPHVCLHDSPGLGALAAGLARACALESARRHRRTHRQPGRRRQGPRPCDAGLLCEALRAPTSRSKAP